MNHRNETVDVLHTISAPKKGVPKGVARHGGTRRIREWGPLLSRFPTELDIDYSSKFDVVKKSIPPSNQMKYL